MQLQLSEQEQLETEDATFPLEHPEQSLFPVQNFGVDKNNALHSFAPCRWSLSSDGMYVKCGILQ